MIPFACMKINNEQPTKCVSVYDASAKIPSGVITGNILQLGNYDECMRIVTGHDFQPQACGVTIKFEILNGTKSTSELDMKDLFVQVAAATVS